MARRKKALKSDWGTFLKAFGKSSGKKVGKAYGKGFGGLKKRRAEVKYGKAKIKLAYYRKKYGKPVFKKRIYG